MQSKKVKVCRVCGNDFPPWNTTQKACSPKCALDLVRQVAEKDFTKETRNRKKAILDKDRRHWVKKAQTAFNAYIRERDKSRSCISCPRPLSGKYDAGHYRPAGNNSAVRFCEDNTWGQCVHCNQHKSGNLTDYRLNLIERIGLTRVEWLESQNQLRRWEIEELKEIYINYTSKKKSIINEMQCYNK